jgi:hypothetical protein
VRSPGSIAAAATSVASATSVPTAPVAVVLLFLHNRVVSLRNSRSLVPVMLSIRGKSGLRPRDDQDCGAERHE